MGGWSRTGALAPALCVALCCAQPGYAQSGPAALPDAPAAGPQGLQSGKVPPATQPNAQPGQVGPNAGGLSQIAPPPPPPPDPRRNPPSRPGALSLDQVLTLARAQNPALLAARRNLDATRAQEIQAGVRQNPNLGIIGGDVTLPGTGAQNPDQYSVQVSRLFERGQKRRWRLDVARATTRQTEAQLRDQERGTELAVKQAFVNMLIAKAALGLSQANLADFQREVEINNNRYKAGDIGKLDYERLDLQLAQFESDQSAAIINLRQASDQLQTLIGTENPKVDFDIAGNIVPPSVALDLTGMEAKALAARPDYQAALAAAAAADAGVKLAYANGTADPTLEAGYDVSQTYNTFDVSLNIPLRIFDRNQGNKKTSEFAAQGSRFTVIAAKNQVYSDVDQAWIGYTQSKSLSDRYSSHYLDEAADVLSIAQFAYEHGGIALIDYLDALRDSRQTTSDALAAYSATWLAVHQLSYAAATEVAP